MAADLASLQVNITGTGAQATADSIRTSLENMGAAGDTAAAKVESVGQRAATGLQPAAAAARSTGSAYQTMFERIASAGNTGGTTGLASLAAEANRAQMAFEALQKFAIGMAQLGDAGSAGMGRMADRSAQAAAAIQGIVTQMGTMIAEGDKVSEVIAMMTERLEKVGSSTNFTGKLQAEFSGLREEFARIADQTTPITERTNLARTAIEQFGNATRTASETAVGGLEKVDTETRAVAAHLEALRSMQTSALGTSANFLTNLTMGVQALSGGGVMQSLMGFQQLGMAAKEGEIAVGALGASFVLLVPILGGVVAAMAAFHAGLSVLTDGMKGAAQDESFEIRMKNVLGTTQAATTEISKLQSLATTGSLSFINVEDLKSGALILEQFTGGALNTEAALKNIGGAAAESGKSFTEMSTQIGKMYANISIGAPIRTQLLQSLASEGVISERDVTQIKNMATAHASASDVLKRFTEAIQGGNVAADQAKNSWAGLTNQLSNVFSEDISQPLGAALEGALKPALASLSGWLSSQSGNIQGFANEMEIQLLTAFKFVELESINKGLGTALVEVGSKFGSQLLTSVSAILPEMIKGIGDALHSAITNGLKNFKVDWDHELGLPAGTIQNFTSQARNVPNAFGPNPTTGVGPTDTLKTIQDGAQSIFKNMVDSFLNPAQYNKDQDAKSAQKQDDAAQKQIDAANTQTQAAQAVLNAMVGMSRQSGGFNMADRVTQTGPFPGAVRTMAYGPVVGEFGGAQMFGATGPGRGTPLQENDVAMSVSLMSQMGLHLKDFVDILDQSGKVLLAHQHIMDTSWKTDAAGNKIDTGGIETRARELQNWTVVRPSMGQNIGPAPADTTQDTWNQAHAYALQQVQPTPVPDTTPKTGVNDETLIQKNTAALKAYDELVKQASNDYSIYGTKIKTVQEQVKDGQISVATGISREIGLTRGEITALQSQIGALNQMHDAAVRANDPNLVSRTTEEIKKLQAELEKTRAEFDKLPKGNYWQDFINGIQQAENAWGGFDQQVQDAGRDMTNALASGLTTGLAGMIDGTKSASAAFADMAKSIIASIEQIILKLLVEQAIQAATSALHLGGGGLVESAPAGNAGYNTQFATGGPVGFPAGGIVSGGTPGTDSVHAMLTPGEYVLTTKQVEAIGTRALDDWRKGAEFAGGGLVGGFGGFPGYAVGGLVGYAQGGTVERTSPQSAASVNSNQGHTFNTSITVPSGGGGNSMTPQEQRAFQDSITTAIKFEIARQRKPGGLLNRNSGAG